MLLENSESSYEMILKNMQLRKSLSVLECLSLHNVF